MKSLKEFFKPKEPEVKFIYCDENGVPLDPQPNQKDTDEPEVVDAEIVEEPKKKPMWPKFVLAGSAIAGLGILISAICANNRLPDEAYTALLEADLKDREDEDNEESDDDEDDDESDSDEE